MQFGESMRVEELPEGTRVAYPGVRANAPSDRKTMTAMVEHALDNPIGTAPLREKLRALKAKKDRPKILMAFDDVSIPLPPMRSPDIRAIILEQAERRCIEEGIDPRDIKFVCSIALHRFIREDEFKHVCGPKLFKKYHPSGQMTNYNAVDMEHSVEIGKTGSGERVVVCKDFAEADMMIYANVNYVSMDGGYKSYATGLVHYQTICTQPRQQDAQEDDVALRPSALGVAPEHHPHREGDAATHGRVPRRDGAGRQQVPVVSLLGSGADASHGLVQEAPGEDLVLLPEVSPQLAPPVDFLGPARARTVRTGAGERRRDGGGARDNPASQLRGQRRGRRGPIRHPHPRAHVHRSVHQRHLSQSAPRQHVRPRLLLQHVRGGSASLTPRRSHDRGESDAVQVDQPYPRRVQGHLRGGGGAARARAFRGTAGAFRQRRATERHLSPRSRPRGGARILHVHLGGARHGEGREGVRGWRRGRARTGRSRMGAKVEREGGGGGGARLAR